jgi:Lar family restriction alleviation protein
MASESVSANLLPCPFCGSSDLRGPFMTRYNGDPNNLTWIIECWDCPCNMEFSNDTPERLIDAWNNRVGTGWVPSIPKDTETNLSK